jgi:hypothetical protein
MKKLAIAAIVAAVLATATSGAALYRTRHLSTSTKNPTSSDAPTSSSAALIEVPDVTNMPSLQAGALLTAVQLRFTIARAPSDAVAKNSVISHNPPAATLVPAGTVIALTVSDGPSN